MPNAALAHTAYRTQSRTRKDELGSPSSSSQAAAESRGQHDRQLGTDPRQGAMLQGSNAVASQRGVQHGRQQQAYSSDEDDMR